MLAKLKNKQNDNREKYAIFKFLVSKALCIKSGYGTRFIFYAGVYTQAMLAISQSPGLGIFGNGSRALTINQVDYPIPKAILSNSSKSYSLCI